MSSVEPPAGAAAPAGSPTAARGERAAPRAAPGAGLSSPMVALFAVAAGFAVANIYYSQPLLTAIAGTFGVGSGTAAMVVTAGTVGYAAGLALLVPLGDITDRRRLVVRLLLVVAAMQAVSAAAPFIAVLVVAAGLMSLTAVVAPILVAFAATLAAPEERGKVTGTVLSGVLMGVLLARVAGGLIAEWGGWRAVYATAAVLMVLLAATLARVLPQVPPAATMRYPALLWSVFTILREEPVLRLRCLYGFVSFAGFNILWTSLAFLLGNPPYSYGEALIGLAGLAGVAGAFAARITGPLVDRRRDHAATGLLLSLILVSWGLLGLNGGGWLAAVLLGIVVLDFGVQGMQAVNLSVNYRLRPEARSRITTAYMAAYFSGGVAGSAASGAAYAAGGWPAVAATGAGFAAFTLGLWLWESLRRTRVRA